MSQKVPLEEQVVLITGASSGMSAVVGQQLAQQFDRRRRHDSIVIRFFRTIENVGHECQQVEQMREQGSTLCRGAGEMRKQ
jgi:NADP-dependent 3-hydroxy acid dehydrogenase YdfG